MRELAHLIKALLSDPRSRLHAVVAGWSHPLDRTAMYQLDLLDLLVMRWSEKGKFKPVARPWDSADMAKRAARLQDASLHRKLRPHLYE